MYYPFVRRALSQLDPKRAHEVTSQQLRRVTRTPLEILIRQKAPARPVTCMGLTFKNPLGPAARLDKDGECIDALGAMGFGSIEIGTVTPRPQLDNDKSRIFRLASAERLINHMGLNNHGVDNLVENVKKAHFDGVLGINISRDEDTPVEHDKGDYLICMEKAYPCVGYIAINISSPNIPGLRMLQYGGVLNDLLSGVKDKQLELQQEHQRYVPVAVRTTSDLLLGELIQVANGLVCHNIDGVIATNTTLDRFLVQRIRHCDEIDGPSGYPLQLRNTEIIRMLSVELNGCLPIIGMGDIDLVIAMRGRIVAGVLLVRIYSEFIFKGPPLIKGIVTYI